MHRAWIAWSLTCLAALAAPALAQYQAPSGKLAISANKAHTWASGNTSVLLLDGPVRIDTEREQMTARDAVVWIEAPHGTLEQQRVEIALVGEASLKGPNQTGRSGEKLFVDAQILGSITLSAEQRVSEDLSKSDLYQQATLLRPLNQLRPTPGSTPWLIKEPLPLPASQPTSAPSTQPATVNFRADHVESIFTREGTLAIVLSGNVTLMQHRPKGDLLELQANNAVLFTPLHNLRELENNKRFSKVEDTVTGAYLEGDVRIIITATSKRHPEERLTAERVFYEFATDRAVLTDVVLHTQEPRRQIPIVVRAQVMRQLSLGEFSAQKAELTTSQFATPSYSIGATSAYIRQVPLDDGTERVETTFVAHNTTVNLGGMPVFYLPVLAGIMTDRPAMRTIEAGQSTRTGFAIHTIWGVFEVLGTVPPENLDLTLREDYYFGRGYATGLDSQYLGGFINELNSQPLDFRGDFTSFLMHDTGSDNLGRHRLEVEPTEEWRGRFYWEHQHFFPDDWQVQLTAGAMSDPTFFEEWFQKDFDEARPQDTSVYVKHLNQNEAFTFLATIQPNHFVTNAGGQQEQAEVERMPELGYYRIGDSFANDNLTFYSANTVSGLSFQNSHYSLAQQGFAPSESPGLPSYGFTGKPSERDYRGDFRQEITWPVSAGQFRVVPFIMGRYTAYSESPQGGSQDRIYTGAGMRINTSFWKVDDSVDSDLFDLHRLRHVVEPEVNLFAGAQSTPRDNLFIYDEPIDAINDISAVQLALHQRWQTKRGGPGRWRNVDVFTLNIEGNFFFHQPPKSEMTPLDFRGLFFPTEPEASIPRNSVNADASWRISDSVLLTADGQYNTDKQKVATASIGLGVQHDTRLSYYIGLRYIGVSLTEQLGDNTFVFDTSNRIDFGLNYELTEKYTLTFAESYDFAQKTNVTTDLGLVRHFDRLYAGLTFRLDEIGNNKAIMFNIWPEGLKANTGLARLGTFLPGQ